MIKHRLLKRFAYLLLACLLFLGSCTTRDEPGWTTFSNPNFIEDILFTDNHTLWLAGSGGVARYDTATGQTTRYTARDGLIGNDFYRLQKTGDGSLYVSSSTTTFHFNGTGWEKIHILPKDEQNWDIFTVQFTPNGVPWMTGRFLPTWWAGDEVYRYDGATWEKMIHGYPEARVAFDKSGKIAWVLSSWEGLYRFDGNAWREFSLPFLGHMGIWAYDFVVDAQGNVWMTSSGTGKGFSFYHFDGNQWTEIDPDPGHKAGYLGKVWADPEAGIWYPVGTYGSHSAVELIHLVEGQQVFAQVLPFEDLSTDSLTSLAFAQDGSIWLSSNGYSRWGPPAQPGLLHFANGKWTRITLPADIPGERNTSCVIDGDGRAVFSSDGKLIRWDNGAWHALQGDARHALQGDDQPPLLYDVTRDPSGVLWARSDEEVFFYKDSRWVSAFHAPGYQRISHLFVDSTQTVWTAGDKPDAIWRIEKQTVRDQPLAEKRVSERIIGFGEDSKGVVYLATNDRIFRMQDGTWQTIETFDRDLQAFQIVGDQIWISRYEDNGNISLYRNDGQDWQQVSGVGIEKGELIYGIYATDGGKTIWFSVGLHGVIRYTPATGESIRWTVEDGLAGNTVMSLCQEPTGTIWFGTQAGISRYQP